MDSIVNVLASNRPSHLEIAFDALTAVVGGLVILLALRMAPALTLSTHRLALRISIVAAVLIMAAQMAEVLADFSRLSTLGTLLQTSPSWWPYVLWVWPCIR